MGKAVSIRITGKDDSKQAFSSAHGSLSSLKNSISTMSAGMKAVWNMAAFNQAKEFIDKVTGAVKDLVDTYGKQEQAERKLGLTVSQNANLTASSLERLKKTASDIQKQSIFGDEALIDMQSYLAGLDMTEKQINDIIQTSVDLASTGMVSLEQSVKGMAQSITTGTVGPLAEAIPTLKQFNAEELLAGKAIDFVGAKYKGMAKNIAESSTGMLQQFTNTFNGFKEGLGEKLAPVFGGILKTFGEQLPKLEKALAPVMDVFEELGPLISAILGLAGNVLELLQPVFDFLGVAAGGIANFATDVIRSVSSIVTAAKTYEEQITSAEYRLGLTAKEGEYLADGLRRAAEGGMDLNEQVSNLSEITGISKDKIEKFAYYMDIAEIGAGKIEADTKLTAENLKYQADQQLRILDMYGLMKDANGLIVKEIKKAVEPAKENADAYADWVKKGNEIKDNVMLQIENMKRQNVLLKTDLTDTEKLNQLENQRLQLVQSIIALENLGVTAGETDTRYKDIMESLRAVESLITSISETSTTAEASILKPIEDAIYLKKYEMGLNGEKIDAAKKLELLEEKRKNIIAKIVELEKERLNTSDDNDIKKLEAQQEELKKAQTEIEAAIKNTKSIWGNISGLLSTMAQEVAGYALNLGNSMISYFTNLITSSEAFASVISQIDITAKSLMANAVEPLITAIYPLIEMFLQIVSVVGQAIIPIFNMLGTFIQNTMPIWQVLMDIIIQVIGIIQMLAPPILMIAQLFAQFLYPILKIITPLLDVLKILLLALMPIIEILAMALDAVSRPFEFLADVIIFVVKTFQTLAYNLGVFINNLNPFGKKQSYQNMPTFQSDAFSRPLISFGGYASELGLDSMNGNTSTIGSISGSTTNVAKAPDIYLYNYFQGPVVGTGGMKEAGEFMVSAIQEYVGAGGKVVFEGA